MPPDADADAAAHRASLEPGTAVEVRIALDRSWSSGFVIEVASEAGYTLRRQSDGVVLPRPIPTDAVRRERRTSMWWV